MTRAMETAAAAGTAGRTRTVTVEEEPVGRVLTLDLYFIPRPARVKSTDFCNYV